MKGTRSGLGSLLNHAFLSSPFLPSRPADLENDIARCNPGSPKQRSLTVSYPL